MRINSPADIAALPWSNADHAEHAEFVTACENYIHSAPELESRREAFRLMCWHSAGIEALLKPGYDPAIIIPCYWDEIPYGHG